MVVYADILIVLNFIVDYFLLLATAVLLKRKINSWRAVGGAAVGGVASLYIFLPAMPIFADIALKIVVCAVMALVTFGFKCARQFLKAFLLLFAVTCSYGGIMIAVLRIFGPKGMVINNSVVYFNISPLVLVAATVLAYLIFTVLSVIFRRSAATAAECSVTVFAENEKIEITAIADTGNSLKDTFGKSEVIIADKSVISALFGETDIAKNPSLSARFRVVPCSTVSGEGIMEGFRCDGAEISLAGRSITLDRPILAVSKTPLRDGYNAIINPEIFD